jgi:hypothetical protein
VDAIDYQNIATIGSLLIGLIGAVAGVYFKNGQGKYGGLLGETVALMQDLSMTMSEIREAMKDGTLTATEVETVANMVEDMELHVAKIQDEIKG